MVRRPSVIQAGCRFSQKINFSHTHLTKPLKHDLHIFNDLPRNDLTEHFHRGRHGRVTTELRHQLLHWEHNTLTTNARIETWVINDVLSQLQHRLTLRSKLTSQGQRVVIFIEGINILLGELKLISLVNRTLV